jgi:hypothetical protein
VANFAELDRHSSECYKLELFDSVVAEILKISGNNM